jgi:hypothetical protein
LLGDTTVPLRSGADINKSFLDVPLRSVQHFAGFIFSYRKFDNSKMNLCNVLIADMVSPSILKV